MKYYFDNNLNIYDEIVSEDLLTDGKEIKALGYFSTYKEAENYLAAVYNIKGERSWKNYFDEK